MYRKSNLSDEVYDFRIRHDLTQEQLAELVGLNRATINYIECGRREPARYTAARLRMKMREIDQGENGNE